MYPYKSVAPTKNAKSARTYKFPSQNDTPLAPATEIRGTLEKDNSWCTAVEVYSNVVAALSGGHQRFTAIILETQGQFDA
jgi:hypothetical protein